MNVDMRRQMSWDETWAERSAIMEELEKAGKPATAADVSMEQDRRAAAEGRKPYPVTL